MVIQLPHDVRIDEIMHVSSGKEHSKHSVNDVYCYSDPPAAHYCPHTDPCPPLQHHVPQLPQASALPAVAYGHTLLPLPEVPHPQRPL